MSCSAGRVVRWGAGLLGTAAAVVAACTKASDNKRKMAELQQALKASQAETRRLKAAYKLSLAESASKSWEATVLQNTAAGLQDCLSRAKHQQAQLQEALSMYADYISAADERILQLQEALAAALEESAAKDKHVEFGMLRARAKSDKQQARHTAQMQKLEDRFKQLFDEHYRLMRDYNAAARAAEGAEAARDAKQEELALLQQQLDSMKECLTNSAGSISSSFSSNDSTIYAAPHSRTQSEGSESSEGNRRYSSGSDYSASDEGSGSACCGCGECADADYSGALSPREAEARMLWDMDLISQDGNSNSDDEEDGAFKPRVKCSTVFSLDLEALAEANQLNADCDRDSTVASLAVVMQSRGVDGVSAPKLEAALQHITDSTAGFAELTGAAAEAFAGAVEVVAVEQAAEAGAEAALQAAAAAKQGALQIVGAAEWWGSDAMCMAGAVVACGGPVLVAVDMESLLAAVQHLVDRLDNMGQLYGALVLMASTDLADRFFAAA